MVFRGGFEEGTQCCTCCFVQKRGFYYKVGRLGGVLSFVAVRPKTPRIDCTFDRVEHLLTAHGVPSCSYEKGFSGIDVPVDHSSFPELMPFSDLKADRLLRQGSGH